MKIESEAMAAMLLQEVARLGTKLKMETTL
jgi:hypothetical protein